MAHIEEVVTTNDVERSICDIEVMRWEVVHENGEVGRPGCPGSEVLRNLAVFEGLSSPR